MNDVAATIGIEQLKYIDDLLLRVRDNATFFDAALQGLPGIRTIPGKADRKSACWLYTIHADRRQEFRAFMLQKNVMVSQVHARNDRFAAFSPDASVSLPNVDEFTSTMMCIPNGWWLERHELVHIASAIREFACQGGNVSPLPGV